MQRQAFEWSVTDGTAVVAAGTRYAHNSALNAGIAAVREIARGQGQTYSKGPAIKDRLGDPLTVRVIRPA